MTNTLMHATLRAASDRPAGGDGPHRCLGDAGPAAGHGQKVGGQLNYLGWEGYDEPDAFKPMTDQGVVFNRTYIGNNDELIAKFRAGGAGAYDVGNINSRYLGPMVKQGMIMPIDESKLTHHKNLFRAFKDFGRVDGKLYTVPVFFGFTTLCYRTDMVPKPTWDFYKDPKFVGKYGVAPNPLGDIYVWAMVLGKGMDARKWTQDDLKQIKERGLAEFRNAKTLVSTPGEQKDLLIRGDVVLTTDCYDAVAAGAVAQGAKVASVIPPGPRKIWVDMYFILNGAKNLDAAYAYLNTALSPQAQAIMAKKMELNVSNQDAYKQLPPDLVKKLGPEQANELIAGSEFNILPDPDPSHRTCRSGTSTRRSTRSRRQSRSRNRASDGQRPRDRCGRCPGRGRQGERARDPSSCFGHHQDLRASGGARRGDARGPDGRVLVAPRPQRVREDDPACGPARGSRARPAAESTWRATTSPTGPRTGGRSTWCSSAGLSFRTRPWPRTSRSGSCSSACPGRRWPSACAACSIWSRWSGTRRATRSSSAAARRSASRWRGRWSWSRRSCCSTSRWARWISSCARRCRSS